MAKKKNNNSNKKTKWISLNDKRIVILTLVSILALVILITTSYARFENDNVSEKKDLYKTGELTLEFQDDNGNAINLDPAYPVSDNYGSNLEPYVFSIENNGTYDAIYTVVLVDEVITNSSELTDMDVKSNIKYKIDNNEPMLLSDIGASGLASGCIKSGDTLTYNLRLWVDKSATIEMENATYQAKVGITGKAVSQCSTTVSE